MHMHVKFKKFCLFVMLTPTTISIIDYGEHTGKCPQLKMSAVWLFLFSFPLTFGFGNALSQALFPFLSLEF